MIGLARHCAIGALLFLNVTAQAADVVPLEYAPENVASATPVTAPAPPEMFQLQEQDEARSDGSETAAEKAGLQIRGDAVKEAAWSYGARGGLAYRTFNIQRRVAELEPSLTKVFDFQRLLLNAPSGLLIEPPIVTDAQKAVLVAGGGQQAAVADRIIRINRIARIVTAPRNWRVYLERDWGRVDPPPAILLPRDVKEREVWRQNVKLGWEAGVQQADDIFQADIDRLTMDFVGMVRYRELLAQGMISAPFAMHEDRGITGGGAEMRIGDRGVTITGQSTLIPRSPQWQATLR